MKQVFLLLLLAVGFAKNVQAQSGATSAQNADFLKNYDGVRGNFEYALNARERMNVNYALTPKNPVATAHFMVHTPEAMPFWATISDASGKTVYTWKPEQKVYLYNVDWNVAKLAAGTYKVNIYLDTDKKSIYQFDFTKQ